MRHWWRRRRPRGDRGSLALELSILALPVVGLLAMMISAGRVTDSASKVETAARDGARAASINHNGSTQAERAAQTAVDNSLQANGVSCAGGPAVAIGGDLTPGQAVRVTVTCKVALLLGSVNATVSRTGVSVLDTYRGTT